MENKRRTHVLLVITRQTMKMILGILLAYLSFASYAYEVECDGRNRSRTFGR